MEEKGWKEGIKNDEREERILKGKFLGFGCVLECSETPCVFFLWLDSLFIAARVNLDLTAFL